MNYCVNLRTRELAFENAKKKTYFASLNIILFILPIYFITYSIS